MKRILARVLGVFLAAVLSGPVFFASGMVAEPEAEQLQPQPAATLTHPDISMTVRYDYDDRVRAGVTVPAFVDITNTGPAIDGLLRLSITPRNSADALCYEVPAYVDEGGSSSFVLPFLTEAEIGNIRVHLVQDGEPVAEALHSRSYVVFTSDMLVGVLSADPDGLAYRFRELGLMDDDGARLPTVQVDISASDFPDDASLLDRFSLIVTANFDLGLLSEAQRNVLIAWVRRGGRLLTDAAPENAQAVRSLAPLADIDGTGAVAALDESGPLVREYPAGAGKVFATEFSMGDSQIHQNGRFAEIMRDIRGLSAWSAADRPDRGRYYGYGGAGGYLQDAVRSIEWLDAPSVAWILAMLLGFIVLAAPISYVILRKKDRRDLIWITAPALSLICCAVIVGYGIGRHGVDPVSSVVTIIDSGGGAGFWRAYSAVGIAAPRQGSYKISVEEDGAFPFRFAENYYYDGGEAVVAPAGRPAVRVDAGSRPAVTFERIRQWSMDTFCLRRDIELSGRLEAEVHYRDSGAFCTVRNNSGYHLEDVTVVTQAGYLRIPLLENGGEQAGEVAPYEYAPGYASQGIEYWNVVRELYGGRSYTRGYLSGAPEDTRTESEKREDYLKSQMIYALLETSQYQRYQNPAASTPYTNDGSIVWGWSRQAAALKISANGKEARSDLNRALISGGAKIAYEIGGEMHSLLGRVTGVTVAYSDSGAGMPPGDQYAILSEGDVTFAFNLPDTIKSGDVSSMNLSSSNARGDFSLALLNSRTGEWDVWGDGISLASGINISVNAGDYVGADGRVQMKITAGRPQYAGGDGDPVDADADSDIYYDGDASIDSVVLSILGKGR